MKWLTIFHTNRLQMIYLLLICICLTYIMPEEQLPPKPPKPEGPPPPRQADVPPHILKEIMDLREKVGRLEGMLEMLLRNQS